MVVTYLIYLAKMFPLSLMFGKKLSKADLMETYEEKPFLQIQKYLKNGFIYGN